MAHSKLYVRIMNSVRWRRLRNDYLTAHTLCERCEAEGYIVAAQCVHHKTPVESGRTDSECEQLAFSWYNLQALCYRCHAEIHQAERSRSGEAHRQRAKERLERWVKRHTRPDDPQNVNKIKNEPSGGV